MSMSVTCCNDHGSFMMNLDDRLVDIKSIKVSRVDPHYLMPLEELEQVELIRDRKLRTQTCICSETLKVGCIVFHVKSNRVVLVKVKDLYYCGESPASEVIEKENSISYREE